MGRGVSCGGGQSSLGFLFGGGGDTAATNSPSPLDTTWVRPCPEPTGHTSKSPSSGNKQNSASNVNDSMTNNYHRADGQNCGNFITNRPSTKVHAAPGGSSSLGYLFGGGDK